MYAHQQQPPARLIGLAIFNGDFPVPKRCARVAEKRAAWNAARLARPRIRVSLTYIYIHTCTQTHMGGSFTTASARARGSQPVRRPRAHAGGTFQGNATTRSPSVAGERWLYAENFWRKREREVNEGGFFCEWRREDEWTDVSACIELWMKRKEDVAQTGRVGRRVKSRASEWFIDGLRYSGSVAVQNSWQ